MPWGVKDPDGVERMFLTPCSGGCGKQFPSDRPLHPKVTCLECHEKRLDKEKAECRPIPTNA